jgi:diaminohydroxyphosphoribosylaminopyrimidine deaminase/5-amino-6-(5-phosphoribosylamino)uracil reductase
MRQALALGERNLGRTAPNPSVGAVLVDEGVDPPVILSRAVTAPGGRPHAERLAIDAAGGRSRGATLFVTLEPCSHHGRTPPCAEAVIAAGVARVVCGFEDPDGRVAGKGLRLLREAGVSLTTGVMEAQCRKLHAGHVMRVTAGRPHVTLKLAMTADGFAADTEKGPLAITGAIANAQTHLLRARSDAILGGVGTVVADDPMLTCRLPGLADRSPIRVVLDGGLRTPPTTRFVLTARETPTLIFAGEGAPREAQARLAAAGVEILRVPTDQRGLLDLVAVMKTLGSRGITLVMCEGGPRLADELARHDLVDELVLITGAKRLAGPGLPALGPSLAETMSQSHLVPVENLAFGEDRWARYERASACLPAS